MLLITYVKAASLNIIHKTVLASQLNDLILQNGQKPV